MGVEADRAARGDLRDGEIGRAVGAASVVIRCGAYLLASGIDWSR